MKIVKPEPFLFEAGKRAVLLLHGFTSHSNDVRMMGRFLQKHGYTCYAPIYSGHGVPPEELLKSSPADWWEDVQNAYNYLKELGYEEIAVGGLSLGGALSLKLGYSVPIKGIFPMCAPVRLRSRNYLYKSVLEFARTYKKMEGKTPEQIEAEVAAFDNERLQELLTENKLFVDDIANNLDLIYAPIFVIQASLDMMVDPESANIIYESVSSNEKYIKWYKESGHVITVDKEKNQLHEDILEFLNSLDWVE